MKGNNKDLEFLKKYADGRGVSAAQFKALTVFFLIPIVFGFITFFRDQEAKDLVMLIMFLLFYSIFALHYYFFGPIIRQILRLEERFQKEPNGKL